MNDDEKTEYEETIYANSSTITYYKITIKYTNEDKSKTYEHVESCTTV